MGALVQTLFRAGLDRGRTGPGLPDGRRVVNIELTDAGRGAAGEIPGVLSSVQNAHLSGFTEEEFQTLKSYLRRILSNAKASCVHTPATTPHPSEGPNAA